MFDENITQTRYILTYKVLWDSVISESNFHLFTGMLENMWFKIAWVILPACLISCTLLIFVSLAVVLNHEQTLSKSQASTYVHEVVLGQDIARQRWAWAEMKSSCLWYQKSNSNFNGFVHLSKHMQTIIYRCLTLNFNEKKLYY